MEAESEDDDLDLDQEKLVQESNEIVVDILKCVDKRSFIVVGDALSRTIAFIIQSAVMSNVMDPSEQEKVIESIIKASKFYLNERNDKVQTH